MNASAASTSLLELDGLVTSFRTDRGTVRAVDGVNLRVERGKTTGLVGESGCGKSVTALSIMRLIPSPPGAIEAGHINFHGRDLLELSNKEMRGLRGKSISMVFQEPQASLNPVFTIGSQIIEAIRAHERVSKKDARDRAIEMLDLVKIPAPEKRIKDYPHQLSGGMCQRAMIAMALALNPELLIADEPTTALDVTIEAQILDLMQHLREDLNMGVILITHDLGIVAEHVDEVLVMYAGRVVERAPVKELFANPMHPYTRGLMASLPQHGGAGRKRHERLHAVPGQVPPLHALPSGCRFRDRCPEAEDACADPEPTLREITTNHWVRCIHA